MTHPLTHSTARFARERSDARYTNLESTKPLKPLWHDIAGGLLIVIFMIAVFVVLDVGF